MQSRIERTLTRWPSQHSLPPPGEPSRWGSEVFRMRDGIIQGTGLEGSVGGGKGSSMEDKECDQALQLSEAASDPVVDLVSWIWLWGANKAARGSPARRRPGIERRLLKPSAVLVSPRPRGLRSGFSHAVSPLPEAPSGSPRARQNFSGFSAEVSLTRVNACPAAPDRKFLFKSLALS